MTKGMMINILRLYGFKRKSYSERVRNKLYRTTYYYKWYSDSDNRGKVTNTYMQFEDRGILGFKFMETRLADGRIQYANTQYFKAKDFSEDEFITNFGIDFDNPF